MVALTSLALKSAKKPFQKGNLENKHVIGYLHSMSGAYVRAQSVGIYSYTYWDFTDFFRDISSYNET